MNPDVLEDMRDNEAYDAYDSEVCQECMSHGMATDIYCVAKQFGVFY